MFTKWPLMNDLKRNFAYTHAHRTPLRHWTIDSNLTWSPHCNYIANKLSRICGVVSRLKHYVPTHILTIIYNSLFLSHISYGITSWGFNMCTRISKLQKKVIRFLTNSKFNSHTAPLFKQLGLLKAVDNYIQIGLFQTLI